MAVTDLKTWEQSQEDREGGRSVWDGRYVRGAARHPLRQYVQVLVLLHSHVELKGVRWSTGGGTDEPSGLTQGQESRG